MRKKITTELFCLRCNQESLHTIEYNGQKIVSLRCEDCGKTISAYWQIVANPLPDNLTHKTTLKAPSSGNYSPFANVSTEDHSLLLYGKIIISRIITKPVRLNHEIHKDLTTFLCSIPVRVITKPLRVAKEYLLWKNTPKSKKLEP